MSENQGIKAAKNCDWNKGQQLVLSGGLFALAEQINLSYKWNKLHILKIKCAYKYHWSI